MEQKNYKQRPIIIMVPRKNSSWTIVSNTNSFRNGI